MKVLKRLLHPFKGSKALGGSGTDETAILSIIVSVIVATVILSLAVMLVSTLNTGRDDVAKANAGAIQQENESIMHN